MNPEIDQRTLVNIIAIDRSTVANVVGRLESKGWIKRVADRRSKRLTITAAGRKVLRAIDSTIDHVQKLILAPLSRSEQLVFVAMLERLVELNNSHSRAPLGAERETSL